MEPYRLTIVDALKKLQASELTSVELTKSVLERIQATNQALGSYLTVFAERALAAAQEADAKRAAGETLPLLGIPIAIKDNMHITGEATTCASKILEGFKAPFTSTAVERLQQAGVVLLGKTNLDEFAMGSSTENSALQQTVNPWSAERVPGGSSGGSAVAVAADQCLGALGSDTGGSIRQPAAFCGVVGLKPTYGRVSRYGLVAFASSLDQIGPFAKNVADAALLLQVLSGHDPQDSTSSKQAVPDYGALLDQGLKGKRLAVVKELLGGGIQPEVVASVKASLKQAEAAGAIVEEVELPEFTHAIAVYYLVATSEASSNLSRFDGVRFGLRSAEPENLDELFIQSRTAGFGPEVKRRIMLGTYALSAGYYDAYYLKAQKVRTLIKNAYEKIFASYDAVISPTAPTTAFKFGAKSKEPLSMYLSDIATIPVNLAGLPAISIPSGLADNLPVGLQIVAKPFAEPELLQIAAGFEQLINFSRELD